MKASMTATLSVPKIRTILFATDFSPASGRAQQYATDLATRFAADLVVAHACEPRNYALPPETWPREDDPASRIQQVKESILNSVMGIKAEFCVGEGSTREVLASITAKKPIDLIVLGTRGRTGLSKILLGSQAEEVLRHASCPVLTVGPDCQPMGEISNHFAEILYATDFSPESLEAVPHAISFALALQARLAFLHVLEKQPPAHGLPDEQLVSSLTRLLRSLVPNTAGFWEEPQWLVEHGEPAKRIVEIARKRHSGLILLGVRTPVHAPGAGSHFKAGLAHTVIVNAECPVLTVRG
jgi:nucleotide-binding universal stress UspA family protein